MEKIVEEILEKLTKKGFRTFASFATSDARERFVRDRPEEAYSLFILRYGLNPESTTLLNLREYRFIQRCYDEVGKEFVRQHANGKYHHSAYFISEKLGTPISREPVKQIIADSVLQAVNIEDRISFMGSVTPDVIQTLDLNWRNQASWDNMVRSLEED